MNTMTLPGVRDADSPNVTLMPPLVFKVCLLAGFGLEFLQPTVVPFPGLWLRVALGSALALAGFAFMMWGHGRFMSLGVNVPTNKAASCLVISAAYRHSRNPMYVGFMAMLIGIGAAAGSVWVVLSALPMGLYLGLHVIPREEAYLERAFGEAYRDYRRTVRRWL